MRQFFIGIVILAMLGMPLAAVAQTASGGNTLPTASGGNTLTTNTSHTVVNPLGVNSICGLIKGVLSAALQIGIPIAVLFIVWAGFKFVLARGNSTALQEARRNLFNVLIGIAIFFGAWLLGQLIANTVNNLQQGSANAININACN